MADTEEGTAPGGNVLLEAADACRFGAELQPCKLELDQVLVEANEAPQHVYFPTTAVVSLVVPMDGKQVEVATVGNEGIIGLPVYLDEHDHLRAVVQVPGEAMKLPSAAFAKAVKEDAELNRLTSRYTLARLAMLAQSVACNQLHTVNERVARWLLMYHDRICRDQFELTHEFLARMLAVRRPTISEAASKLQTEGIITYKRGHVTIVDRLALERATCGCYRIVTAEFDRLVGPRQRGQ